MKTSRSLNIISANILTQYQEYQFDKKMRIDYYRLFI